MSDGFGKDVYTISDDEGNNYELEHLDTIEMDGVFYLAFLPVDGGEDSGMVILKSEKGEDGDDYLVIPDEDEEERAYERFMQELFQDEDE
ncbi:MAG: DUF1292 domain-containing protein [Oscillospiraceae bacterium]